MQDILVSIVCEVYNHEPYLRDCLDGFIMQKTDFPFEILIHDDASTDHSADIIREYEKRYPELIKPIYQEENQFSRGIQIWHQIQFPRSKGKYIALCEGDDYWIDPYKIQKQVDYLETNGSCVLTFHNAIVRCGEDMSLFKAIEIKDRSVPLEELLNKWAIPTASVMFRRDAIKSCAGAPFFPNADYALEIMLFSSGSFHYEPACMSVYRKHPGSLSEKMDKSLEKTYGDLVSLLEYCKDKFPSQDQAIFNSRINEYKRQIKEEILKKKYPFLKFLSWRYYKRVLFSLLRIRRGAR